MKMNKEKFIQMHQQMSQMEASNEQSMKKLRLEHEADQKKMKKKLRKQKKSMAEFDELRKKVDLYEGKAAVINTMSLTQLNGLKRTLQDTMNGIETAKEKKEECI